MKNNEKHNYLVSMLGVCAMLYCLESHAADQPIIDFSKEGIASQIKVAGGDARFTIVDSQKGKCLEVTCTGGSYPGVEITPTAGSWDLSAYGGVEADMANTGAEKSSLCLRIDNAGDWQNNPWSTETAWMNPGKDGRIKVDFGYSWGKPGYKLDSSKIIKILVFSGKPEKEIKFRVYSIRPVGKPGDAPAAFKPKIIPQNGLMLHFAKGYPEEFIESKGTKTSIVPNGKSSAAEITFLVSGNKWPSATIKGLDGASWNLTGYYQAEFYVKNPGAKPVRVFCRVDNPNANGVRDCVTADAVVQSGTKKIIVVPFNTGKVWDGNEKPVSGTIFNSYNVSAVTVFTESSGEESRVLLEGVKVSVPRPEALPEWLGRKPPVPGNWKLTFEDNFEGNAIDGTKWSYYGPNYWDKKSHWSKDNAIIGNGLVKLRYDKKRGPHNDDPNTKPKNLTGEIESDYVGGYLDTFGKFTQTYGYFEARMKLPAAPGLWPAFWMMPDRGEDVKDWKRSDTSSGGMEFDIMEHLTRWGVFRYNIAMHWDGYQKDHKSIGSSMIYCQPDKDGFITCGLLWQPGLLVYYCNGIEVARWKNERVASVPEYMMFTLPQGGWDNDPIDDSRLPDDFIIDYVRVWQNN